MLADVFENFRKIGMNSYKLDPAYYISLPGYSNDCLYKFTGQDIQLLTDVNDYEFFEKSIRGGISMIGGKRLGVANNKYMENYDPELESRYLMYWDANNLYGGAMMETLPIGGFKWLPQNEVDEFFADDCKRLREISYDSEIGYHLEVDIETPSELHDYFDDYPLCPESIKISNSMIGDYGEELLVKVSQNGIVTDADRIRILKQNEDKCPKLVLSLTAKTAYKISYRYLQFCLAKGMKVSKIHRIIQYDQKAWMAPYIQFNTDQRTKATSTSEKDFYKLMNNAVFGKSMENVRNRFDFRFCTTRKQLCKLAAKDQFQGISEFNSGLVGVSMLKATVHLNKPVFIGACILDMSKLTMAKFHYDYVKVRYPGTNSRLLFTDTDSLAYEIKTEDVYEDMRPASDELFDFSEYPRDHPLQSNKNKKVVNKFKDEAGSKIITGFVGLRSKMYAYQTYDPANKSTKEDKKCKGIKKSVVKQELKFNNYREILLNESKMMSTMTCLRSYNHEIHTITQTKTSLSAYDNKRFLINSVESRSHGHWRNAKK